MSEVTATTSNDKKSRTPSIAKLTEKKKALEKELKATQEKLEEKQKAKSAKEKEKAKKDRTKALILLGLYFLDNFKDSIQNLNFEEINNAVKVSCYEITDFYKHKKEKIPNISKKLENKILNEMLFLIKFIDEEIGKERDKIISSQSST